MAYDQSAETWTSALVLSDVRRKASLPATSVDYTDAALLREATDVLWSFAGWALQQSGEGRLLEVLERPASAALSSSYRAESEFDLPPLAIAGTIDHVVWLSAAGDVAHPLARVDLSQQAQFDQPGSTGDARAYTIVGGRVRIYPQPTTGGTLRITYARRHPSLVADVAANVGTVSTAASASAGAATALTLTATPPVATGDTVDVINPYPPYSVPTASASVASVVGNVVTLAVPWAISSRFAQSGLRVVRAGTSPYVHYPLELRACVSEKVAANVLRLVGDMQGAQAAEQAAREELGRVVAMLSPRAKRDRPKVVNPYSHMRLRGVRGGRA